MNSNDDTLGETAEKLWQIVKSWFKPIRHNPNRMSPSPNKFVDNVLQTKKKSSSTSTVTINGRKYNGDVIGIKNGRVMVNGVEVSNDTNEKVITISVDGDVQMLAVDSCEYVKISGNANKVETMSGNVTCGDVTGDVTTMSGSVTCGNINGDVETMSGNIRRK